MTFSIYLCTAVFREVTLALWQSVFGLFDSFYNKSIFKKSY